MKITKRQRNVLSPAILFGWTLDEHCDSYHIWDGDILLPFRAFEALDHCLQDGVMKRIPNAFGGKSTYRVTERGISFTCRAKSCQKGRIYKEDTEIGKCSTCEGTGVVLSNEQEQQP